MFNWNSAHDTFWMDFFDVPIVTEAVVARHPWLWRIIEIPRRGLTLIEFWQNLKIIWNYILPARVTLLQYLASVIISFWSFDGISHDRSVIWQWSMNVFSGSFPWFPGNLWYCASELGWYLSEIWILAKQLLSFRQIWNVCCANVITSDRRRDFMAGFLHYFNLRQNIDPLIHQILLLGDPSPFKWHRCFHRGGLPPLQISDRH